MQHGAVVLEDLDAGAQEIAEQPHAVPSCNEVVVVAARDQERDADAPARRVDQRVDGGLIGDEVGIGNVNRSPRADDRKVVERTRRRGAGGR
jgi:hypothetical protein